MLLNGLEIFLLILVGAAVGGCVLWLIQPAIVAFRKGRKEKAYLKEWFGTNYRLVNSDTFVYREIHAIKHSGEMAEFDGTSAFEKFIDYLGSQNVLKQDQPKAWLAITRASTGSRVCGIGYAKGEEKYWHSDFVEAGDTLVPIHDRAGNTVYVERRGSEFEARVLDIVVKFRTRDGVMLHDFANRVASDCLAARPDAPLQRLAELRELAEVIADPAINGVYYIRGKTMQISKASLESASK